LNIGRPALHCIEQKMWSCDSKQTLCNDYPSDNGNDNVHAGASATTPVGANAATALVAVGEAMSQVCFVIGSLLPCMVYLDS
jgi:hypothetical protein